VNEGKQKYDDSADDLMAFVRSWQAEVESKKISQRVSERMKQLVAEGEYTEGVAPFSYELVRKGRKNKNGEVCNDLCINEKEAEYVRQIFEKTVREGYGSHRLAQWLNEQGVRMHNGTEFKSNAINRILRRLVYTGYRSIRRRRRILL